MVREQRESGKTVASFCEEKGISKNTFNVWKAKAKVAAVTGGDPLGFVELVPKATAASPEAPGSGGNSRGGFMTVKVAGAVIDMPVSALPELIKALRAL